MSDRREKAVELLARMTEAHGASGSEDNVRRVFREALPENLRTDRTGSIIHEKRGTAERPRIMVAGHMDEVGFMVQHITRSGMLKFVPLGGWIASTLPAKRVRILTQGGHEIIGVIGAKPPHSTPPEERDKPPKIDQMFIDVGAMDDKDVRERFGIRVGDTVVPDSSFTRMHNPDLLLCKAFDNRVGMSVTVQAMLLLQSEQHPNTVFGVGTAQEEVGIRGGQTAVHVVKPDVGIVIEGAPADDFPGTPEDERHGRIGKGVQIRLMDPSAISNGRLARFVIRVAEEKGIPHQIAVRSSGGTDAKPIHLYGEGVPTVVLGVPARYIHTHNSIIHLDDYLGTLELTLELLRRMDEATVRGFTAFLD
jgi:endoglucanase